MRKSVRLLLAAAALAATASPARADWIDMQQSFAQPPVCQDVPVNVPPTVPRVRVSRVLVCIAHPELHASYRLRGDQTCQCFVVTNPSAHLRQKPSYVRVYNGSSYVQQQWPAGNMDLIVPEFCLASTDPRVTGCVV